MNVALIVCQTCKGAGEVVLGQTAVPYGDTTALLEDTDPCEDCGTTGVVGVPDTEAEEPLGVGEFS